MNTVDQEILISAVRRAHPRATKTDNARSATEPNTFLKNKAATVTPLASISSYSFFQFVKVFRPNNQILALLAAAK